MRCRLKREIEGLEVGEVYDLVANYGQIYLENLDDPYNPIPKDTEPVDDIDILDEFFDRWEVLQLPSQETIETITVCINNNMDEMFNQIKENPNVRPDLIKTFYVQNTSEHIKTVLSGGTE